MTLFIILIVIYGLVSSFIFLYSLYKERSLSDKPIFGKKYLGFGFFFTGYILTSFVIALILTDYILSDIPENAGYHDADGWHSVRSKYSTILAVIITGIQLYFVSKWSDRIESNNK